MGWLITITVRLAVIAAIWVAWGPLLAAIAFAAYVFDWVYFFVNGGQMNRRSAAWLAIGVIDLVMLIAGFFAVGAAWGTIWVVGLLVIFVLGLVEMSRSSR